MSQPAGRTPRGADTQRSAELHEEPSPIVSVKRYGKKEGTYTRVRGEAKDPPVMCRLAQAGPERKLGDIFNRGQGPKLVRRIDLQIPFSSLPSAGI